LAHAQHVLLVTGSDLVSLWHGRIALLHLQEQLGIDPERISLVINRYDRRYHHERGEIEWHFGVAAAQVIPRDSSALERAVAEQTPVVLYGRSAAGRAILDLAGRIHQRRIRLADLHADGERKKGWRTAVASGVGGVARWSGWS
jgi:Flp pilus assembly CpaE family ATPase